MTSEDIKRLGATKRHEVIESLISEAVQDLLNDDTIAGLTAETNALGFGLDTYDITAIDLSSPKSVKVKFKFSLSGDQEEDKPWCGDTISGTGVLTIDERGNKSINVVNAEKGWPEEEKAEVE